jgi:hypothetical protein
MHIHYGVSMSNGHAGLQKLRKSADPSGFALFINKKWTAMKLMPPGGAAVLHYKAPSNRPIEPKAIKHLPNCVSGKSLNYNQALELALVKEFERRGRR